MSFAPKVLKVDPEREFRWRGVLWHQSLFCGEHFFTLKELGSGVTRVTHAEDFSGLLLKVLSITKTARGFVFMNQALKRRCESSP
jgi:hypothetical protein